MHRFIPLLFLVLGLILSTAAHAQDRLTVLLDWFVNPDHAPLVIAKERGLFARHGLEVTLTPPADPTLPPRIVVAKEAEIAVSYQPNHTLNVGAGMPLIRFGTLVSTPLNTVMALQDGPVKTLADLKGKRIGYSVAGFEDALLKRMLAPAGLTLDDVTLINVNFSLSSALLTGEADAVIGGFRNFEATQLRLKGKEALVFYPEEHGVPAYEELIFITHRDLASDPRLPRFLAALEEATLYLTNHPQEAETLFFKAYPDLDDELNRAAFSLTLPRFAKRPGAFDEGRYARFAAFLQESGLLDKALTAADLGVRLY